MSAANYVIGLDIGTTCTKALAVAETGEVLGGGSRGYRLFSEGNRIEQNPLDWIAAAAAAVRERR
jgi:sugar (pentulose or hexulose) kinase